MTRNNSPTVKKINNWQNLLFCLIALVLSYYLERNFELSNLVSFSFDVRNLDLRKLGR